MDVLQRAAGCAREWLWGSQPSAVQFQQWWDSTCVALGRFSVLGWCCRLECGPEVSSRNGEGTRAKSRL